MDIQEDGEKLQKCKKIVAHLLATAVVESLEENPAPQDPGKSDKELVQYITLLQYYTAGIVFIKQIENAVPHLITLLASNTKGEVVETMHFFVIAYRFEMECAMVCNN